MKEHKNSRLELAEKRGSQNETKCLKFVETKVMLYSTPYCVVTLCTKIWVMTWIWLKLTEISSFSRNKKIISERRGSYSPSVGRLCYSFTNSNPLQATLLAQLKKKPPKNRLLASSKCFLFQTWWISALSSCEQTAVQVCQGQKTGVCSLKKCV